jgi:hypothetical protein
MYRHRAGASIGVRQAAILRGRAGKNCDEWNGRQGPFQEANPAAIKP